jgi:hypothetical protein
MKLTWFGATTMRIYAGGKILVVDAEAAPVGVEQVELMAGADLVLELGDAALETRDLGAWRPRRAAALIDAAESEAVEVFRIGEWSVLIDAPGEPPLALVAGEPPRFGRWADGAVVVLLGNGAAAGEAVLTGARPKLVALAEGPDEIDAAVEALRGKLDGAGLLALEQRMAVEV